MELRNKLNREQKRRYITISEYTWGCVPIDVGWATGTNIYKDMEAKLLLSGVIKSLPDTENINVIDKAKRDK